MKLLNSLCYTSLLIFVLDIILCSSVVFGEDNIDYFVLPETPPTIERLKKPPLDRPILKKQNYITQSEITPPPVLSELNFPSFYNEDFPVSVSMFIGNYSSLGGDLLASSENNWSLIYQGRHSKGEVENLFNEKDLLNVHLEHFFTQNILVRNNIDYDRRIIWTQRHEFYNLDSTLEWFARKNLSIKAGIVFARGEIKNIESNNSIAGDIKVFWQPVTKHNLFFSYFSQNDSSEFNESKFYSASMIYSFIFPQGFTIGGGGSFQNDNFFPLADFSWKIMPNTLLSASYEPGIKKIDWDKLYNNDWFENNNPLLNMFPEAKYLFKEKLSYYWSENSLVEVELRQEKWYNYVYWSRISGTEFLYPANIPESYISGCMFNYVYKGDKFSPNISLVQNSFSNIPMTPEYELNLGFDYDVRPWSYQVDYKYTLSRYVSFENQAVIPGFGNLSVSLKKVLVAGTEAFLVGENLLNEVIEVQPGFRKSKISFRIGIKMDF